jgi:outer membrane lipoprotein
MMIKGLDMNALRAVLPALFMPLFILSCSVISQQIRDESIGPVHFKTLIQETDQYKGHTVILGGYILETQNLADTSVIKVLQAPLGLKEAPKSKDDSEGRFIIVQKGFLDPEIYEKDRKITVAGTVVGTMIEKVNHFARPYLKVESREIYLWPKDDYYYPQPYYDPWYYPYPHYWYPYRYYPW